MIHAIPNPKKIVEVQTSPNDFHKVLEYIPLYTDKYKLFKNTPNLSLVTLEASEFLSVGVYIDINYHTVNDNRVSVTIEVRRKVGTFDQSHEVTLANGHIEKMVDLISHSLETDPSIRLSEIEQAKKERERVAMEIIQKRAEQMQKNPVLFWGKYILAIGACVAAAIYMLTQL